ncbi:MAG: glycine cleavage system aminomethyltransferase GcvT [Cohaesibacteraceae bacterium]|nr:glycine cleavage system aminomethyltransferase GcvT [Cohaesibacteraceae bacterium]
MSQDDTLLKTPLYDLHIELGARMVPFAGYSMPVQYKAGIIAEHTHCRESASLFDVSHMGQCYLVGPDFQTTAKVLEALTPSAFTKLQLGRQRYALLMKDDGTILDDLMVTRPLDESEDGRIMLVVNAGRKTEDYAHIRANLPDNVTLETVEDRALVAVQGPKAIDAMVRLCPEIADMVFMDAQPCTIGGAICLISRTGYTGEDGFEISLPNDQAEAICRLILDQPEVEPCGLGARDSLRLEAGLCLYGHDIDETTSPVEADLVWSMQKRRREEGGFPGADRVLKELVEGVSRKRVGFVIEGRAPAREGAEIQDLEGNKIGTLTSGGFGVTFGGPIGMGYVSIAHTEPGTKVKIIVRKRELDATVTKFPLVPQNYVRASK